MSEQTPQHNQEPDPQFTQRFIDAIGSVNKYNARHTGIGGAMVNMVNMILDQVKDEDDQHHVSSAEKAAMERELIQYLQTDELEAMGIGLFDLGDLRQIEVDKEDETQMLPPSLFMLITDTDKFEVTLDKLNPTDEQQEHAANSAASLLSAPIRLIQATYPHKEPEEGESEVSPEIVETVVKRQLDQFIDLAPHLAAKGFNIGYSYETLSEYATRYSEGTLSEFREAEAKGLLNGKDLFGPGAWVKDMGSEHLTENWSRAFDLLQRLREREEPTAFFTELFKKLRSDFDEARRWLNTAELYDDTEYRQGEGAPQSPGFPQGDGYPKSYVDNLKRTMDKISPVWEESFPLENSYYLAELKESGGDSTVTK